MEFRRYFANPIAIIFYILGFIIILSGLIWCIKIHLGWGSIFISIGIAIFLIGISKGTEEMMKKITKSSLYETMGVEEERRLFLREKFEKINKKKILIQNYRRNSIELKLDLLDYTLCYFYSIYIYNHYFDRAMVFQKYFSEEDEDKIIHYIDNLFQELCLGKENFGISLEDKHIRRLENMHNELSKLKLFNSQNEQTRRCRILYNLRYLKGLTPTPIYY